MLVQEHAKLPKPVAETVYGALDLGTNNCRLLLAVRDGSSFAVVDAFSRMTRLGEGLAASGVLSDAAIHRTVSALKFCADKLSRRGATRIRAVATEACRRAQNHRQFLEIVEKETGLALEVISAEEEARLALTGCASLLASAPYAALVFDIGGGSTELIDVKIERGEPTLQRVMSVPIGVVTLAEAFGTDLLRNDGYNRVVDMVSEQLRPFDPEGLLRNAAQKNALQMLGTSGTVTTLAGIHLDLERYDRARVDGLEMDFTTIAEISAMLLEAPFERRAAHPCIGPQRADLVVAGCAILAAICRLWPTGRLRIADRGVREGLLLSMMREDVR
jgi:exopolyphosphatase/guanosine-5'-triphosphate,3'-diphosphate pyrophosphatase